MSCGPFRNLAVKIRGYGHVAVALVRLRIANAILSQLPFLQRFIDAKLVAFKVVDAQRESLTRPQTTHSKNSQYEVLPRRDSKAVPLEPTRVLLPGPNTKPALCLHSARKRWDWT